MMAISAGIISPAPKRQYMAIPAGIEPATHGVEIRYSIQLSYGTGAAVISSAAKLHQQGSPATFRAAGRAIDAPAAPPQLQINHKQPLYRKGLAHAGGNAVISIVQFLRFLSLPIAMAAFIISAQMAGNLVPRTMSVQVASSK
jgi:hypothetical protein